jgi:hypothetical protein
MNQNHLATKKTKNRLGSKEIKGTGQNVVEKAEYKENIYKANNKKNQYKAGKNKTEANKTITDAENGGYEVKTRRPRHTAQSAFKTTKFEVEENVGMHFNAICSDPVYTACEYIRCILYLTMKIEKAQPPT